MNEREPIVKISVKEVGILVFECTGDCTRCGREPGYWWKHHAPCPWNENGENEDVRLLMVQGLK